MFDKYRYIFIFLIFELLERSCRANTNSTSWSTLNLLVDPRLHPHPHPSQTTENIAIVVRSIEPTTLAFNSTDPWTKIEVSLPPVVKINNASSAGKRYHATVGNTVPVPLIKNLPSTTPIPTSTPVSTSSQNIENHQDDFAMSVVDTIMKWANRSLAYLNATQVPKKGKLGEKGHAFLDDLLEDDDYEDDDDEDDEDDDGDEEEKQEAVEYEEQEYNHNHNHNEKDKDETDEIEETEPTEQEAPNAVETEPQEEYENYAETKPPIILRTRRKNKRKRGKKHGKIKIKHFKKWKKFMLPLLLAYKLKFFTLVPLLLGGLVLIVATTGFAGFFFALFAVGLGMKHGHH